jgi:hypothetical protein
MTGILILCGITAAVVTLVVLGGNRKPTPTLPDLGSLAVAEMDRRERERRAAEIRSKLEAILTPAAPEAPRPNE